MDVMKKQIGGQHYKDHAIQPWDIIDIFKLNFYEGNALKYLLRRKDNRIEDLGKCIHYLEKQIVLISPDEEMKKYIEECFEEDTRDIVTPHYNSEEEIDVMKLLRNRDVDAQKWAKAFMQMIVSKGVEIDEGLMISWFANAIMTALDKCNEEKPNDSRETSSEGIEADAEETKEIRTDPTIRGTKVGEDSVVLRRCEELQECSDSNSEECSARCDTSSPSPEGESNSDELSQCEEAFTVTEVRPDSGGRGSQVGGRVSEIFNDLARVEKAVRLLRYDIQLRNIDTGNICKSLSDVGSQLQIALEKIRNLQ